MTCADKLSARTMEFIWNISPSFKLFRKTKTKSIFLPDASKALKRLPIHKLSIEYSACSNDSMLYDVNHSDINHFCANIKSLFRWSSQNTSPKLWALEEFAFLFQELIFIVLRIRLCSLTVNIPEIPVVSFNIFGQISAWQTKNRPRFSDFSLTKETEWK